MGLDKGDENPGPDEPEFTDAPLSVPIPEETPNNSKELLISDENGEVNNNKESVELEETSPQDRMQWDNHWEFLMSCISMSVGLGNVWRFPVTALKNGGGAFLVPYLVVLIFIGRPIYFLELCLGQFTSCSQVKVWKCLPMFQGVGYGSMIATMVVLTYYVSIMALTCFYFLMSFKKTLPWSVCDPTWADKGACNGTGLAQGANRTISEMYYINEVLREYKNIENGVGNPDWRLSLCLVFCWIVIFLSLIRGVKSSGKVAYFTAIFPYVVMIVLLIRGVTLKGAWEGIKYFIEPDWKKILEPGVWYAAVSQCFFSLNTGFGSIVMFSSYNKFDNNIYRDAWIVSVMDTFTSLLAGFTIFAILGNLANELGVDVRDVVRAETGLAFVSYPDAIAKFHLVPQLFAVLFFMMLFTLGIGSSMADTGAIITIFCDRFPDLKRWKVTSVVCLLGCAVGVVYCTPGGQFILTLVDYFGCTFVVYLTSTLEVIGIAWIYGCYNFSADIEFMLKIKINWYWKFCWGVIIPVALTVILIHSLIEEDSIQYNDVPYPTIALICGWIISAVALLSLPVGAFHSVYSSTGSSWKEKFRQALSPGPDWGPRNPTIREEWVAYKETLLKNSFVDDVKHLTSRCR